MNAPLTIREGTPDDAPGMAALINGVIVEGAPVLLTGTFSEAEERAFLAGLPPRGGFHVAEAPGTGAATIVAAQVFAPYADGMPAHDHVVVMGTWVAAGWRRCGLGRSLWERTAALAGARGFTKVFTDVRADNVESLAFHFALGFGVVGTARAHATVGARAYDVVFIERGL